MRKWIQKLCKRLVLPLLRGSQVAQFENVRLCDFVKGDPEFQRVMLAAFQLIKDTDPRRFARVNRQLKWVVRNPRAIGQYHHYVQSCTIDFYKPETDAAFPFYVAWYASQLIRAATRGLLASRDISYSAESRERYERLCLAEQNRFARRFASTQPEVAAYIHKKFDEAAWREIWKQSRTARLFGDLWSIFSGRHK